MLKKILSPCLILLLAGCAPTSLISPEQPDTGVSVSESARLEKASSLEQQGNWLAAANEYTALAAAASGEQRYQYQLQAARALLLAGHTVDARKQLNKLPAEIRDPLLATQRQLLLAEIALTERDFVSARKLLNIQLAPSMPPELHARLYRLRSEASAAEGDIQGFIEQRTRLESYLADSEAIRQNHEIIWRRLMNLSQPALQQLHQQSSDSVLRGWTELALIAKQYAGDSKQLAAESAAWQQRYPGHPAPSGLTSGRLLSQPQRGLVPERIALLLPLQGQFSAASTAVMNGFLAAYYADQLSHRRPQLHIYNVDEASIKSVYARAVAEGADFVVGPLQKDTLSSLTQLSPLTVPVLALNTLPATNTADNVYQFGLSPEDEARHVAERIWLDGHRHGAVLVPQGEWGQRIETALHERLEQLGVSTVQTQSYNAQDKHFSKPVSELLNINQSKQRHRALQNTLGLKLKFDARRRQDLDFIFLAAFPRQARQIRPELTFYKAGRVPVYSTSHVYSGKVRQASDRDMNGIIFGDMPWTLRSYDDPQSIYQVLLGQWPEAINRYSRLVAMGIDAYNVLPYLQHLSTHPQERFYGETGGLQIDAQRRISRYLTWAQFKDGLPKLIE
jgi:outer membrane PBP1 activator LpoA protein